MSKVANEPDSAAHKKEAFRLLVKNTLERRLFYIPSFKIYGGVAGLYDYGPWGCAVETNLLNLWRQHFVMEEDMFEIRCPCVTPEVVLKASGHVDKFTDLMVKDEVTGDCHRADHLLKNFLNDILAKDAKITAEKKKEIMTDLASLDEFTGPELGAKIKAYNIKAPDTGNEVSEPYPFNLMFATTIGPTGLVPGYMRPETAQGIFVNFKDLYYENGNKLPFAAAQIGSAFRNEGIVDNETLGYFIARTYLFLTGIGINKERLRFRQHLQNEMAHYAQDCWDAEIECSYGWFECVGLADRSAFDLKAHTSKSGVELVAHEVFDNPKDVEQLTILPNKKILGKVFRKDQKILSESLQSMNEAEALALKAELEEKEKTIYRVCTTGQEFELTKEMVTISQQVVKTHGRNFTPSVIEPSFGVGRIMYCLYEHCFYTRPYTPGEQVSSVFRFPPLIAPIKCTVFPLIQREILNLKAKQISNSLTRVGVSNKMDVTGRSIGKRYARTDEVGIPFAITVDFDEGVTVRERDSKQQIRVPDGEVVDVVRDLANGSLPWAKVTSSYQVVLVPDTEAES
ncbi:hypothetical protein BDL97_07G108400 [Sphagnum fallax]|nr:hypothetical protein BDL97_07G108400 [Sphagnum fallax]